MYPGTHLLLSWVIAAKTTDNARDCRLVTLAGILPDADGLGVVADIFNEKFRGKPTQFYQDYHHYLLHGAFGAVVITALLVCFARRKLRVAALSLALFHLHLLCDFVSSRGPSPDDLWPIYYLGPFTRNPMWMWKGQWPLDWWPLRVFAIGLCVWALWLAPTVGYSFVGVFSSRLDRRFVETLRKWRGKISGPTADAPEGPSRHSSD